jgi:hypothetical protein
MEGACPSISHIVGLTTWLTGVMPSLLTPGDVSLSAEDRPPKYLIYRPPAVQLQQGPSSPDRTPIDSGNDDGDDDDDDDDGLLHVHHVEGDHHGWLGGETALKFLAAGGVAGAGQIFSHPTIADPI